MKKIFLLLLFTNFCFSQISKENYLKIYDFNYLLKLENEISEPIDKYYFYQHLFLVSELNLYIQNSSESNYSNEFIYEILRDYVYKIPKKEITINDLDNTGSYYSITNEEGFVSLRKKLSVINNLIISNGEELELELRYLFIEPMCERSIDSIKDNFIYISGNCGTGASMQYHYLFIKDNDIIDMGSGFDKLSEKESKKLDKMIKRKIKDYSHISYRNGCEIEFLNNGNFKISFRALTNEDSEASGGSLLISYETKNLVTFIPESLAIQEF